MYISFDETDVTRTAENMIWNLESAHTADRLIEKLWTWLQTDSKYRGNYLIITTDHGHGNKLTKIGDITVPRL